MQTNAFYTSLNEFCRKYWIQGSQPLTLQDMWQLPAREAAECAALFEHLLLFDTVSIKVHGENVSLAFIVRLFGQRHFEELIDQQAIRFVLWTQTITHNVSELPGLNALQSADFSSPAHSDPEQSIEHGLKFLGDNCPTYVRKQLKRKVIPLYETLPSGLAAETVALTNSAFTSGKLRTLGFDPTQDRLDNLVLSDRARLSKCAHSLFEYRYLMSRQMTAMSSFNYFSLFSDSLKRIELSGKVIEGFSKIATLENLPDLQALFPTLRDGLKQVPKFRAKRQSRKFREWLASAVVGEKTITEEYLAAISEAKAPLDTKTGKFFKALGLALAGAAAGHFAEGALPGALAGGLIAQGAGPAVDFSLDLLDEFLLDGLRKGWHPRLFFNDLRKLEQVQPMNPNPPHKGSSQAA
jgi:hypothetical protein